MLRITMAQAGRKAIGTGATETCLPIQFFALAEEAFRDETTPPNKFVPYVIVWIQTRVLTLEKGTFN